MNIQFNYKMKFNVVMQYCTMNLELYIKVLSSSNLLVLQQKFEIIKFLIRDSYIQKVYKLLEQFIKVKKIRSYLD